MQGSDLAPPCYPGSMNAEFGTTVDPQRWAPYRWWSVVALVLTTQVGLIFWLGDQGPVTRRSKAPGLGLELAGNASSDVLALNDPTLFALPHREGFAGQAWLAVPN